MDLKAALPVFLSKNAAARRLDIPPSRLQRAVDAGAIAPAGLLDGYSIFAETEISAVAADLIRLRQVRGSAVPS